MKKSSILFFLLFWPALAFADLKITEVMYDPPGANAGHQWVEVTNVGSVPQSIFGYKVFSGGVNHLLKLVSGTTTIQAGESAIFANTAANFSSDFPNYHGTIFNSAISLLKSGSTITLKDASLNALDTVSYDASAGASSDGNSLHRSGSTLTVGAPNPGSIAPTNPIVPAPKTTPTSAATKGTSQSSRAPTAKQTVAQNTSASRSGTAQTAAPLLSQLALPEGLFAWVMLALGAMLLVGCGLGYLYLQRLKPQLLAEEFDITSE